MSEKEIQEQPAKEYVDSYSNVSTAQRVTTKTAAAKMQTKREWYNFLTIDCDACIPGYDNVTMYFIRDLVSGERKCKFFRKIFFLNFWLVVFRNKKILSMTVPQYETLSMKKMMEKFGKQEDFLVYLPDKREWSMIPRQWLIDVMLTFFKEDFRAWVHNLVEARNEYAKGEEEDQIVMDPEIFDIFQKSTLVSSKFPSSEFYFFRF